MASPVAWSSERHLPGTFPLYALEARVPIGHSIAGEAVLWVLEAGPDELAELRGVLLREQAWRVREGLA